MQVNTQKWWHLCSAYRSHIQLTWCEETPHSAHTSSFYLDPPHPPGLSSRDPFPERLLGNLPKWIPQLFSVPSHCSSLHSTVTVQSCLIICSSLWSLSPQGNEWKLEEDRDYVCPIQVVCLNAAWNTRGAHKHMMTTLWPNKPSPDNYSKQATQKKSCKYIDTDSDYKPNCPKIEVFEQIKAYLQNSCYSLRKIIITKI